VSRETGRAPVVIFKFARLVPVLALARRSSYLLPGTAWLKEFEAGGRWHHSAARVKAV